MPKTLTLSLLAAAALATSACITVIDADSGAGYAWKGDGAQSLDSAKEQCRDRAGAHEGTTAFVQCMAEKGWTRTND